MSPATPASGFLRGYGYQGNSSEGFHFGAPGYGEAYKKAIHDSVASISLQGFGECLPNEANRVEIDPQVVDAWGIPALRIVIELRENERAMLKDMADSAAEMLEAAGGTRVRTAKQPALGEPRSGHRAHGHRSEDLGPHAVSAAARCRKRLRDGRIELPVRRLDEPDADDDGAGGAVHGSAVGAHETRGRLIECRVQGAGCRVQGAGCRVQKVAAELTAGRSKRSDECGCQRGGGRK